AVRRRGRVAARPGDRQVQAGPPRLRGARLAAAGGLPRRSPSRGARLAAVKGVDVPSTPFFGGGRPIDHVRPASARTVALCSRGLCRRIYNGMVTVFVAAKPLRPPART